MLVAKRKEEGEGSIRIATSGGRLTGFISLRVACSAT